MHWIYHGRLKTYVEKNIFWQERNQWNLQEAGHSEISKGRSFMGVLKYLISSVRANKMKLLWAPPFRNKLTFPYDWNIRKEMVQVPSKLIARLVCNILKESDL